MEFSLSAIPRILKPEKNISRRLHLADPWVRRKSTLCHGRKALIEPKGRREVMKPRPPKYVNPKDPVIPLYVPLFWDDTGWSDNQQTATPLFPDNFSRGIAFEILLRLVIASPASLAKQKEVHGMIGV